MCFYNAFWELLLSLVLLEQAHACAQTNEEYFSAKCYAGIQVFCENLQVLNTIQIYKYLCIYTYKYKGTYLLTDPRCVREVVEVRH